MTREQAIPYISFCIDDALNERSIDDMPANARLVGWQCGFEPLFVAVWSCLTPDVPLEDDEASESATAMLDYRGWFSGRPHLEPDFVI